MEPSQSRQPVPFSIVLEQILEPRGYRLRKIVGKFRYFDPPVSSGPSGRRIGFPVENGLVDRGHVENIIKIIDEDTPEARR